MCFAYIHINQEDCLEIKDENGSMWSKIDSLTSKKNVDFNHNECIALYELDKRHQYSEMIARGERF